MTVFRRARVHLVSVASGRWSVWRAAVRSTAASDAFERLLDFANDLGLFAEEIDPDTGIALGTFPRRLRTSA